MIRRCSSDLFFLLFTILDLFSSLNIIQIKRKKKENNVITFLGTTMVNVGHHVYAINNPRYTEGLITCLDHNLT